MAYLSLKAEIWSLPPQNIILSDTNQTVRIQPGHIYFVDNTSIGGPYYFSPAIAIRGGWSPSETLIGHITTIRPGIAATCALYPSTNAPAVPQFTTDSYYIGFSFLELLSLSSYLPICGSPLFVV